MGMNNTRNGKWEIEKKIIFLFNIFLLKTTDFLQ